MAISPATLEPEDFGDFVDDADAFGADEPDAVGRVVQIAEMMAVFAAERLMGVAVVLAEARERDPGMSTEILDRSVRLELAAALRITEYAAGELLTLADGVRQYPVVLDALGRAAITERHAQMLVSAVNGVEPEHRAAVLSRGLALAIARPIGTFRTALRTLVESVRVTTLAERHLESVRARRVIVEPAEDGMAWLSAFLPSVEAHAIHGRLTAIAGVIRGREDESRTLDEVRADALCDLLIDGTTTDHPVEARGIRATVVVTVPVLTLLGAEGEAAVVEGVGPIPLKRARELCAGEDGWMRVLTHPETGMVLSVGRERYSPPRALRKLVKWRAARCMAPGCGIPAARCQIDHNVAWHHGGPTALWNHAPFCQGHHTIKHHGGWTIRQLEGSGGAIEWTSPTRRRYIVQPERPVPVFRASEDHGRAPF